MTEQENRPEFENNESSREGSYRAYNREGYNRYNRNEGGYNSNRRTYTNNRPYSNNRYEEGYGRNNEMSERGSYNRSNGYNPRYNSNRPDNRGGYGNRPNNGYYTNNRFNYNREGGEQQGAERVGYTPRFNPNRPQQRSYNPNFNQGYRPTGERKPRPRIQGDAMGGGYARPQYPGGYRPRTQGYNPHAKYSLKKQIEYKELHTDPDEPIRLNKFLANAGICSRREADEFITAGVVSVNGVVVTELGTKIKRGDDVKFHDEPVSIERKVYVVLNKPKDTVTTSDDPQERKTVMDLVKGACKERIYPVGRLDRNTTGVLLLTNDGDLASKLTHPKYLKKKIYHVYCDKNVTKADLDQLLAGITLDDGEVHADAVSYASPIDKKQVGIEIHSGRNRIVRRMFEALGYRVIKLDRVFFAGLTKKGLRRGDWRFLTEAEVNFLRMGSFE